MRSILRFLTLKICMPKDLIVIAGQMYSDIYILLEGNAIVYGLDS